MASSLSLYIPALSVYNYTSSPNIMQVLFLFARSSFISYQYYCLFSCILDLFAGLPPSAQTDSVTFLFIFFHFPIAYLLEMLYINLEPDFQR